MSRQELNSNLSKIIKLAKSLYHTARQKFQTWGEALKHAWLVFKAKQALKKGKAVITFLKKSGEIVTRTATKNTNLFNYQSKGTGRQPKPNQLFYWDFDKNAFRCCLVENFISFYFIPA